MEVRGCVECTWALGSMCGGRLQQSSVPFRRHDGHLSLTSLLSPIARYQLAHPARNPVATQFTTVRHHHRPFLARFDSICSLLIPVFDRSPCLTDLAAMFARASARLAAAARPVMARAASTMAKPTVAATSSRLMLATVSAAVGASAYLQLSSNTALAAPAPPQPGQRLPPEGVVGTNHERTFIAIKPDGVQRGLIHKIIARFEEKGFQLVGLKLIVPTEDLARGHYEGQYSNTHRTAHNIATRAQWHTSGTVH